MDPRKFPRRLYGINWKNFVQNDRRTRPHEVGFLCTSVLSSFVVKFVVFDETDFYCIIINIEILLFLKVFKPYWVPFIIKIFKFNCYFIL